MDKESRLRGASACYAAISKYHSPTFEKDILMRGVEPVQTCMYVEKEGNWKGKVGGKNRCKVDYKS